MIKYICKYLHYFLVRCEHPCIFFLHPGIRTLHTSIFLAHPSDRIARPSIRIAQGSPRTLQPRSRTAHLSMCDGASKQKETATLPPLRAGKQMQ
ncbi:MAG: hypothetical protein HY960_02990 [Ignavibacteriae bacterium]|nr:hypothetical protein [Ignavibacteriota bacterium]